MEKQPAVEHPALRRGMEKDEEEEGGGGGGKSGGKDKKEDTSDTDAVRWRHWTSVPCGSKHLSC